MTIYQVDSSRMWKPGPEIGGRRSRTRSRSWSNETKNRVNVRKSRHKSTSSRTRSRSRSWSVSRSRSSSKSRNSMRDLPKDHERIEKKRRSGWDTPANEKASKVSSGLSGASVTSVSSAMCGSSAASAPSRPPPSTSVGVGVGIGVGVGVGVGVGNNVSGIIGNIPVSSSSLPLSGISPSVPFISAFQSTDTDQVKNVTGPTGLNVALLNQSVFSNITLQTIQNKALCRIYVGSLDYYLTEAEVKEVFQAFGSIVAVDMPKEGNRSKGFCFIEYSTQDSATLALKTMQGFVLKGRTLKVGRPTAVGAQLAAANTPMKSFIPPNTNVDISSIIQKVGISGAAGAAAALGANAAAFATAGGTVCCGIGNTGGGALGGLSSGVTVGGLSASTGLGSFADGLILGNLNEGSALGTINVGTVGNSNIGILFDRRMTSANGNAEYNSTCNNNSQGINATINGIDSTFSHTELAALCHTNATILNNPNGLCVGNVPSTMGTEDVKKIFSVFGVVKSIQVLNNNAGGEFLSPASIPSTHGGYIFIEYSTDEEAKLAIKAMNNFEIAGHILKVNYITAVRNAIMAAGFFNPERMLLSSDILAANASYNKCTNEGGKSSVMCSLPSPSTNSALSSIMSIENNALPCSSQVIQLNNIVSHDEVDDMLEEEIRDECSRYGKVEDIKLVSTVEDVKIFVCFDTPISASNAYKHLDGRWFAGKQISCKMYDYNAYLCHNYTL